MSPAIPGRLLFAIIVAVLAPGCGRERATFPNTPVGRFDDTSYMIGLEKMADGTVRQRLVPQLRVTIDVRADHTLLYEWRNLAEPGKGDGSFEGTWRDPTAKETEWIKWPDPKTTWFVFGKGEPDRDRDQGSRSPFIGWGQTGWIVPAVDAKSGTLTTAWTFAHRDGER